MKANRLAAIVVAAICVPVMAASYGGGAGSDFTYTNASDINGHFGFPIPSGNDLFFPFATFAASANASTPSTAQSDTMSMDIQVNSGLRVGAVGIGVTGTYSISGTPGANSILASGAIRISGATPDAFVGSDTYTFLDDQPVAGASWSDQLQIIIPFETAVSEFHLEIDQSLMASATDGVAQITSAFEVFGPITLFYPEPSTLAILSLGSTMLLRRRKCSS